MKDRQVFLPGSTVGVMGGGQLGRMFAIAARRMGYRVHTFSPDEDTPTGQLADREVAAGYDDEVAVRDFARQLDVLTFEFENIPAQTLAWCAEECVVRPSGDVLRICQHRLREKSFLRDHGLPLPAFVPVASHDELLAAVAQLGTPCVLKTASFGYDGKGQRKIDAATDLAEVAAGFANTPCVLEAWVPYEREISIIVARGIDGAMRTYPVCENRHANHILDLTLVPAAIPDAVAENARAIAMRVADALDLTGLLAVEMFLLGSGEILINELAPRPHNSGHFSFDASITSQFEQQLRAVCGLPLGSTESLRPSAMANLLGDVWFAAPVATPLSGVPDPDTAQRAVATTAVATEPDWAAALAMPEVKIHLYGKAVPRRGRKMGHLVAFGATTDEAAARALAARAALMQR